LEEIAEDIVEEQNGNVLSNSISKYFTIQKNSIKWQQKSFTLPSINLDDINNESEIPIHLYNPIYYFSKYLCDFDKVVYYTNYMQLR
jgi:biotin synthase-related radical SAM superfamily protein